LFGGVYEVARLLERGADVNARDESAMTPLHYAILRDDVVGFLLNCGAEVNARSDNGKGPLHIAALGDNKSVIERLLAAGADPALTDAEHQTSLQAAAAHAARTEASIRGVRALLECGASFMPCLRSPSFAPLRLRLRHVYAKASPGYHRVITRLSPEQDDCCWSR